MGATPMPESPSILVGFHPYVCREILPETVWKNGTNRTRKLFLISDLLSIRPLLTSPDTVRAGLPGPIPAKLT
jgi:hypothetical protein